jgi:hypothetical protein
MEIFLFYQMRKKQGNKKERESCLHKGRCSHTREILLRRFGNTSEGHALECPSRNRMHKYGNLPYNKKN